LVKLKNKEAEKVGWFKKMFGGKKDELDYIPARIIDNQMYLSLLFDESQVSCSEVRVAIINEQLHIAHGYNRVDYTPIADGQLASEIAECIKSPLRTTRM
jgi:hypothetical protein